LDSQENGTCATITPLFDASPEDIKVADFQSNFLDAEALSIKDILHSPDECDTFKKNLIFTILRTIVKFGGDRFKHFEKELHQNQPKTKEKIKLHKSELYPLPPWNIDESTITGNAKVDEAIVNELKLPDIPEFSDRVRFQGGDQLSIARLRALEIIRGGQEGGYNGFFWGACSDVQARAWPESPGLGLKARAWASHSARTLWYIIWSTERVQCRYIICVHRIRWTRE
ncbi:hypothetical protein HYPSUDRAFT_152096, partial [Hypholoma sublateritium FD-334 SS-4]